MGYRKFVDRDGREWEVRERSSVDWEFAPVGSNRGEKIAVKRPGYEKDPFELSQEELQRLLDSVSSPPKPRKPSPFGD
ncbi:MAG: hypothetical protein O7D29_03390 [Gemmatimonadetes bacterium]|nr:hypothetical protein [Gemmatimonadota bacterium]